MKHLIAPSILSADFLKLGDEINMINRSQADWIHFDVMDGMFVPNISYGIPILKAVKTCTDKVLDVHLMVVQPERFFEDFRNAGADVLTLHAEATIHLDRQLNAIRELGMKAGLALNPGTSLTVLEEVLHLTDLVLIMSVNPGFGGQKFIPYSFERVRKVSRMIRERGLSTLVEVDGGVNAGNSEQLLAAGANVLVAGSYIFKSDDPEATISAMKAIKGPQQMA
jgi:ribulose-phosphate 3-epimerase